MKWLLIPLLCIWSMMGGTKKTQWTPPQTRPGFVNPFITKVSEKQRLHDRARVIKAVYGTTSSVEEIAADLSLAEFRRKK